ncbi:unannotated protein [freshwater metagenome]|uniref:Unannotated protein n=1 Tax=freshwater metagenome TaxID=449393 RepID=A0A6J6H3E8_9ZZZZ|nr:hypothetical protein [Actinomycetota bacterium]
MKKNLIAFTAVALALVAGALVLPVGGADALIVGATTIDFEIPTGGAGYIDADQYIAEGLTFSGAFGIVRGVSQGDPGNWGLEGTDGPQFLGQNRAVPVTVDFATEISTFSIDCSRAFGSVEGQTMKVTGFDATAGVVDTETFTFGEVNTWSTSTLSGAGIVQVILNDAGGGSRNWGCDRMIFGEAAVVTTTTTTMTPSTTTESDQVTPAITG